MHQEHRCLVQPLEFAQLSEQGCDFAGDVLISAMKPHEGVEDDQPGAEEADRLGKAATVLLYVEAKSRGGDDMDVERLDGGSCGAADAVESLTDDMERILRRIEEHRPALPHREASQARSASGDRDGHVEREERFAALRLSPDDADCLLRPEALDEPALLFGLTGELSSRDDGKAY